MADNPALLDRERDALNAYANRIEADDFSSHTHCGKSVECVPNPPAQPAQEQPGWNGDTGNADADRVIGRLMSSDPNFDDCESAAILIRRLVCESEGPRGYATWKDAAIAERLLRVKAEKSKGDD
jgi:hypothetical protein